MADELVMDCSLRILLLSGCVFLASCGTSTATPQLVDAASPVATVRSTEPAFSAPDSVPLTPTSTTELPETIAFSAADCAGFNEFGGPGTLEELVPLSAHDGIAPISEHFAASMAIGQAAKEKFESVVAGIEAGEASLADDPVATLRRVERLVQASTSPALIPSTAQLANRIEAECGESNLTAALWNVHSAAIFMQAVPPTGYCEALGSFWSADAQDIVGLAPEAHLEWITVVKTADYADQASLRVIAAAGLTAKMYRSVQCSEDLASLLELSG